MGLTKSKGNMYLWVTHVWSPMKGCKHECPYCYTKSIPNFDNRVRLIEKELRINLGEHRIIFVGHLCDMWGSWIPDRLINPVLAQCLKYPFNEYVFQSKNPWRFMDFKPQPNFLYGTTIETDQYPPGFKTLAPTPRTRYAAMKGLSKERRKFVTIEPIMDFNLVALLEMIEEINPEFVTIGADSKGHGLVEPPWKKVEALIDNLSVITQIRQKTNLERLKPDFKEEKDSIDWR